MATLYSDEATVTFGGSDHTTLVSNFTESGGTFKYKHMTGFGNKIDTAQIGADLWNIDFDVKLDAATFYTIQSGGAITVIVTLKEDAVPVLTLTYNNAYPETLNSGLQADNYFKGKISFIVPYYNSAGTENRSVA